MALIIEVIAAFSLNLTILSGSGLSGVQAGADKVVTGLFFSGGTAGFNSIMKFLGYAKEQKAADAAQSASQAKAGQAANELTALQRK